MTIFAGTREHHELVERQARERAQAERVEGERREKDLLAELDEEERKIAEHQERMASLPPESGPERENRELRERVERLEAAHSGREVALSAPPQRFDRVAESRQWFRRDALRILRAEKRSREQGERQEAHEKAVAGERAELEARIGTADAEHAVEDQRHAEAESEIRARRRAASDALLALLAPLGEGETSEDRMKAMGERV